MSREELSLIQLMGIASCLVEKKNEMHAPVVHLQCTVHALSCLEPPLWYYLEKTKD